MNKRESDLFCPPLKLGERLNFTPPPMRTYYILHINVIYNNTYFVTAGQKCTALYKTPNTASTGNIDTKVSTPQIIPQRNNEYYHTVVIATEKLSNSEAKPRCYENFEGDNNRVVIFLINTCCNHFKIEHSFIGFSI